MPTLAELAEQLCEKGIPELPQSAIVYGAPKTGKTALVGQLARKYKIIFLDFDLGAQTLFTAVPKEFWGNITIIRVKSTPADPAAIRVASTVVSATQDVTFCADHGHTTCIHCKAKPPQAKINFAKLSTDTVVVFDTLSALSDAAMQLALGSAANAELAFKKREFDHYGAQGTILDRVLTLQKMMPCHRIFISHEEEVTHDDGTKKITPVAGTRKFASRVAGKFDHVVYTSLKMKKHCISSLTTSDVKVQAGSRNNQDIKSSTDFLDIFSVEHIQSGKTSTFDFAHEATTIAEEEESKAAQAASNS